MKKIYLLLTFVFCAAIGQSQMIIVGNNLLGTKPLNNTQVTVKMGGATTQTLNTGAKSTFSVELEFGNLYSIYLDNADCTPMHFEVAGNSVPKSKYDNTMEYEFDIVFVRKDNPKVDHEVFKKPFYKIIYNGKSKLGDDKDYNTAFDLSMIKQVVKAPEPVAEVKETVPAEKVIIAGKIFINTINRVTINNRTISLLNSSGAVVKTTSTNRFGAFYFTGIYPIDAVQLKLEVKPTDAINGKLSLYNSKGESVSSCKPDDSFCTWTLSSKEVDVLTDNGYTSNIGGKLVSSSHKEKKFFANKNVYLSDRSNVTIKKAKTNVLGSFVFEDVEPDHSYFVGVDKAELAPGEKIDLLSKEDSYIGTLDSTNNGKAGMKFNTNYNKVFNDVSIGDDEMKMDVKATIFGDNVNHPIGKLKIVLMNDNYQVIDSAMTDNLGTFKFKYLPFLKRFYLSAENEGDVLDAFKNILIYSSEDNLIKIMTHQKGSKFLYKAVSAELSSLRDIELEDPWLELIDKKPAKSTGNKIADAAPIKSIIENILFETNKYDINEQAKETLNKIILVLNANKHLRIEVDAHTDSKGDEATNMALSQARAKTVSNYMISAGIEPKRVIAKGYGETKLLNNCKDDQPCSETEHAQNRRIEFKISGD